VFVGEGAGYYSTGESNTFIGKDSGVTVTTGAKNTILGRYNGNQNGIDIRTTDNNIVLSDGDGAGRAFFSSVRNTWSFTSNSTAIGRLEGRDQVTVANGGTLTLIDAECGACLIHVYDNGSGDGAVFFANFAGPTALIQGDPSANFSTTDNAGDFCVFKSNNSHTVTFKNNRGTSKNMTFMIVGAQSAIN